MTNDRAAIADYPTGKLPLCATFFADRQQFPKFCNFLLQLPAIERFHRANYSWSSAQVLRTLDAPTRWQPGTV
jgi:hypothetical protein